ncbi:hypothetical protein N657DRAFT_643875 [Parathielavia appendiculata]|uniref:Tim44-like domain-containing protein n=1 Tax=Parathielavia appendiculata TaxID=2587402 RepID=A0AAN6U4Q5_9PEZI|nr:hypothetical protein N657DRAFT_643875 [Parathielavia appendiculata]
MSSSSRLGLRARELLFARLTGPARIWPLSVTRMCLVQAHGLHTSQSKSAMTRVAAEHATPRMTNQASPKTEMAQKMDGNLSEWTAEALSMVIPATFVLPPFSQFPKPLIQKLRLLSQWVRMKLQETVANMVVKFSSKPTIFKAARFKPNRSALIPTAKALHRSMAAALADGDKDTINRVCSRRLAGSLLASIDSRPRGRRYGWELVAYTNRAFYPSIKSHRMSPGSRERNAPVVRQAVVAISSRQRRVQYDAQGQVIPGSEKEMDVVENLAFGCVIDPRTWQQSEWRIIGTLKPTTVEGWLEEKKHLETLLQQR